MTRQKTVAFYTLGCKLNFSETSEIARRFTEHGFKRVKFTEKADVYVINTCTVTEKADKKCRNSIRQAIHRAPEAFVAVVGCYSQLKANELSKIEGIDLIVGNHEKFRIFDYSPYFIKNSAPQIHTQSLNTTSHFYPSYSIGDRTRSFLKVQDGCDYHCAYCTIPLARGSSRNAPIKDVVAQAEEIAGSGVKEIVITGINTGDFGKSTRETFFDLIQELEKIHGVFRYRISSLEPNLITSDIIQFISQSEKFAPHFHIPLQSGSDAVLQRMKRRYSTKTFCQKVAEIKAAIPEACIGVDVIVGFPGETEEQAIETHHFLSGLQISFLHVFTYSQREGTPAALLPEQLTKQEKAERSKRLHLLSEKKLLSFYAEHIDTEKTVLFETRTSHGKMTGFTENYIKTIAPYRANAINTPQKVRLKSINKKNMVEIY